MTSTPIRIDTCERVPFVLVGGVPGAGKSTALAQVTPLLPGVRCLDSEDERRRFARLMPELPYPWLRPVVHLVHHLRVLTLVLVGPGDRRGLVVHDPSTRWVRLALLGLLAQLRGWDASVLFVDVAREEALGGQCQRRRIVGRRRFEGHWRRWQGLRTALVPGGRPQLVWVWALAPWRNRVLSPRPDARGDLLSMITACGNPSSIRA